MDVVLLHCQVSVCVLPTKLVLQVLLGANWSAGCGPADLHAEQACTHVWLLLRASAMAELRLLQGAVLVSPTTALSQVFNVSHNNLTGSVPAFLASSKVPSYTKQGIFLVVMLTASPQLATLSVMWQQQI